MKSTIQLPQYSAAQEIEQYLGDPEDPSLPFSFRQAMEADESETAPDQACQLLDEWGTNLHYIPEDVGGRLQTFEQALALGRIISRRDLSVAIEHSISFLGFAFVWLAGSGDLKKRAAAVLQKGGRIALGLTERKHGGDLSGCECKAEMHENEYLVSGEKWLINNATRGQAISLFVRTDARGGPRGFSFLFVEKSLLDPESFETLPKVPTHGIRGVDISGIRFDRAVVNTDSVIGRPGMGLEIALKGLQVTRTMCANLSLGGLDTALRIAVDFAIDRSIYGAKVIDIPAARTTLTDAFVDLLISDCVSTAGARALHVVPAQMSVHSAIVKYFVPVTCEQAVQSLSVVLGARHFLREGHWHGMFQKVLRDISIVSLFDGSTAVNLNIISSQLLSLCEEASPDASAAEMRLKQLFDLSAPLPAFEPERLSMFNKGTHDVVQAIPHLDRWIDRVKQEGSLPADLIDGIQLQLHELKREYLLFKQTILTDPAGARNSHGQTSEMFELARRYCIFHAAAASVLLWVESRHALGEFFAQGTWLQLGLHRLQKLFKPQLHIKSVPGREAVSAELVRRFHDRMLFSVVLLQLSGKPY
jgi:alkylation response protein AidB-like acyl-CoA dehydrogenase